MAFERETSLVQVAFQLDKRNPGKWDMSRGPRGAKLSFIDNKHLERWVILDLANTRKAETDNFVDEFYKEGQKIGYTVEYPRVVDKENPTRMDKVVKKFIELCKKVDGLQMIVVITRGKREVVQEHNIKK